LKQSVLVELDKGFQQEFPHSEIQPWDELEALRKKSQEPCDRHEGGECDCGKEKSASPKPQEGEHRD
jgi:hypothetical protein